MATLFTKIIDGELPGRFVWRDERCVSFLTISPVQPGHALVVPIVEVDHWVDLDDDLVGHLMVVARHIGVAQQQAFGAPRVGLLIAGLEVPHTHLHVIPMATMSDLDLANAVEPRPADLDAAADALRQALGTTELA